jgi:hypothetical protein
MPKSFQTAYYSYYGLSVLFCSTCSALAVCIGYLNRRKFEALRFFFNYPLASLLQVTIAVFLPFFIKGKMYTQINGAAANIFMITEFIMIYSFFKQVFQSKSVQFIIRIITIIYFLDILIEWLVLQHFYTFPENLFTLQAVCILVPGFYYFFKIFKDHTRPNPIKDYSFWISLSIIFYFSCTLPLFLLKDFAYNKKGAITEANLYTINFICYGIMFLLITKAYLCPKRDVPD